MTPAPKLLRVLLACGLSAAAALAAGFAFVHRTTSPRNAGGVVVETNLAYENAEVAGTGIVLRPSGEMLTNNHVIRGASTIRVVVPGSGRS